MTAFETAFNNFVKNGAQPHSGGGAWYVITVRQLPPHQTPFHVEVSQKPFPGPPRFQSLVDKGPFQTQAEAEKEAQAVKQHDNNPFPGAGAASGLFGGIGALGDLAHRLTESSTWIRVGEFLAGAILLWVGLNAMTKGTAAGTAINSAKQNFKSGLNKAKDVAAAAAV